jgi:O-antigen ligase
MILASTGIVGAFAYAFLFLYYPIIALRRAKVDGVLNLLLLAHLSILIAALGNPYIVSGGMGLFFVVLIAGYVESRETKASILHCPVTGVA